MVQSRVVQWNPYIRYCIRKHGTPRGDPTQISAITLTAAFENGDMNMINLYYKKVVNQSNRSILWSYLPAIREKSIPITKREDKGINFIYGFRVVRRKAVIEALTLVSKYYMVPDRPMCTRVPGDHMVVGTCASAPAACAQGPRGQRRAERAPGREAPALALASAVSGHDGGGHHGQRGRDECGGEGGGEGPPAPCDPSSPVVRNGGARRTQR